MIYCPARYLVFIVTTVPFGPSKKSLPVSLLDITQASDTMIAGGSEPSCPRPGTRGDALDNPPARQLSSSRTARSLAGGRGGYTWHDGIFIEYSAVTFMSETFQSELPVSQRNFFARNL